MFNTRITTTPFSGENSNIFGNITGEVFSSDESFLSTLRALLHDKIPEGRSLSLRYVRWSSRDDRIEDVKEYMEHAAPDTLTVFDIASPQDTPPQPILDTIKANTPDGWKSVDNVSAWMAQTRTQTLVNVNEEKRSTVVFVHRLSLDKYHLIQAVIPFYLPWYYPGGAPAEVVRFLDVFTLKEEGPYLEALTRMADSLDLRGLRIKNLLTGFEQKYAKVRIENIRSELTRIMRDMEDLDVRYSELNRKMHEKHITMLGLEQAEQQAGDSEIMQYFRANKNLTLQNVGDTSIEFIVKGYLDVYNEEIAKRSVNNTSSFLYRDVGHYEKADLKKFWSAVFVRKELRIRMCSAYRLDLHGDVSGLSGYNFPRECEHYYPNPHIHYHSCMGDYKSAVRAALRENDYCAAIANTAASMGNLNFNDGAVNYKFSRDVLGSWSGKKIVELPDGTTMSVKEAIKWLKERDNVEKEKEN
jgi:hypothetical protein